MLLPAFAALLFCPLLSSAFIIPKASLVIAASAVCLTCCFSNRNVDWRSRFREPLTIALYGGFAWLCIVWLASPLRYMGAWTMALSAAALLLFESTRKVLSGSESRVTAAVSGTAALVSVMALAQFLFHFDIFAFFGENSSQLARMRVFSTLGNPDFAGEFLALCLPSICCIRRRAICWTLLALTLLAIACTGSRASLLAAAIAIIVWYFATSERAHSRRIVVAVLTVSTLFVALVAISRWNGRSLGTAIEGRLTIWRVSLHRVSWHGSGPGTFSYVYLPKVGDAMRDGVVVDPRYITPERHAQNDFIEIVVESGPIGALLALTFLALWIRAVWKLKTETACWSFATVSAFLAAALFDFPLHRGETVAVLAIALALPLAQDSAEEKRSSQPALHNAFLIILCVSFFAVAALPVISSRWIRLGDDAESIEDFAKAARLYSQAAKLSTVNTDAMFSATRAYARNEDYGQALQWSETSKRYIAEPEIWILRARILESINENQRALKEMEYAQHLFPYSPLPKSEIETLRAEELR